MLKSRCASAAVLAACLVAVGSVRALEIGDPAPALKIAEWVKGKAVDFKDGKGKNVYLIEFWATWCPPCRAAIPHLTELQKKHKDKGLVVVGVSIDEQGVSAVRPFVKQNDDKMGYIVAVDNHRQTAEAYLDAVGVDGIPYAFLVDKAGRFVWHGYPDEAMDKVIEEILAGKFDLEAAKNADKARRLLDEYFGLILKIDRTQQDKDKEPLLKKARETGDTIVKLGAKSPDVLGALAWNILTSPRIKTRDRDLATKAAKAACDATENKNPDVLDTYARALFDTGNKAEAIKMQKKAVELCKDERMKRELKKTLDRYEKDAGEKK